MSMFQNPRYVDLARRFLTTPPAQGTPTPKRGGRFPDMSGYSQTAQGRGTLGNILTQMRLRKRQYPGSEISPSVMNRQGRG